MTIDYEKLRKFRNENNPFAKRVGAYVTEIAEGHAVVEIEPADFDRNPAGAVHGGCIYTIADIAAGSAASSYGYHAVTVNSAFNFMRASLETTKLTAEANVRKRGKRIMFINVTITDQDGTEMCAGQFTYVPLDRKIPLD